MKSIHAIFFLICIIFYLQIIRGVLCLGSVVLCCVDQHMMGVNRIQRTVYNNRLYRLNNLITNSQTYHVKLKKLFYISISRLIFSCDNKAPSKKSKKFGWSLCLAVICDCDSPE